MGFKGVELNQKLKVLVSMAIGEKYGVKYDFLFHDLSLELSRLDCEILPILNTTPLKNIATLIKGADAIILTGGNDIGSEPLRDAVERALIDGAIRQERALLGICRGAQMLASYFGSTLVPCHGHIATTHELVEVVPCELVEQNFIQPTKIDSTKAHLAKIDSTKTQPTKPHSIKTKPAKTDSTKTHLKETIVRNSYHAYGIARLGDKLVANYKSKDGLIEVFSHENLPLYGVMSHMERELAYRVDNELAAFIRLAEAMKP